MPRHTRAIVIGLVLIGALLYAFNMGNVLFWDDADWILNNPCVQAPMSHLSCLLTRDVLAGIGQTSNYFRPLLMLTFAFNWALGGASPFGYHLISNALHIANAIVLFLLLSRLLKEERVAAIAALIWLVHPLQTEAVAYISGRGDPLSVCCMLVSMLLWLRSDRWRWGAIATAVLAILSRETAVLLPLYMVVTVMVMDGGSSWMQSLKRSLIASWPFFAISALYGILRLTVLNFAGTLNWYAASNVYTEHISYRIYTFLEVFGVYARLMVMPLGLHMERNVPVMTSMLAAPVLVGAALLLALIVAAIVFWRRGNRVWMWSVFMMLVPLAPSSGILAPINALIYEHWLYLSLIGFAVLVAMYAVRLYDAARARYRWCAIVLIGIGIGYGVFLSTQTILRNIIWGQPERLYQQIIAYEPQNVRVLNNLANLYADQKKPDDAERYWRLAIAADPQQPAPYHNIGNLHRDRGEIEQAIAAYEKAIQVDARFWYSYQNLAAMLLDAQRPQDAFVVLMAWQKADPSQPLTYYALAKLLVASGKRQEARAMLDAGLPAAHAAGGAYEEAFRTLSSQL